MDALETIARYLHGTLIADKDCNFKSPQRSFTYDGRKATFTGWVDREAGGKRSGILAHPVRVTVELVL